MPKANFDNRNLNLPSSGGKYIRLKSKGDKIKFLIANTPHYETKHWIDNQPVLCTKYNSKDNMQPCDYCEQYQDLLDQAGGDEELKKKADELKPQVTFYYPILNLTDNTANIFQTTQSVHWTIVGYAEEGVDVFNCAWSVERTEDPGNYYAVRRLDKVKLSKEQKELLNRAKNFNINKGKLSSTVQEEDEYDVPDLESEE